MTALVVELGVALVVCVHVLLPVLFLVRWRCLCSCCCVSHGARVFDGCASVWCACSSSGVSTARVCPAVYARGLVCHVVFNAVVICVHGCTCVAIIVIIATIIANIGIGIVDIGAMAMFTINSWLRHRRRPQVAGWAKLGGGVWLRARLPCTIAPLTQCETVVCVCVDSVQL